MSPVHQEEGGGCKSCQGSEAAALLGQASPGDLCQQGKCQHSTFHYFGDYTCNQTLLSTKCFINGASSDLKCPFKKLP